MEEVKQQKKKVGNPAWEKGVSGNIHGRPVSMLKPGRTNREIRSDELMKLLRKFSPHQTKAIQTAVKIIENDAAADANRLKASALIIQTFRQLLLDTFDHRYDTEENNEIQDNSPVFSLKIIGQDDDEKTGT